MRKKVLIILSFVLVGCSLNAETSIDKIKSNLSNFGKDPELVKLENRKERWLNAEKCVKAMSVINGKAEELCSHSEDIQKLTKGIGTRYASKLVKTNLKRIDGYEQQLSEGIIDRLPEDVPITIDTSFLMIDEYRDNAMWSIKRGAYKGKGSDMDIKHEKRMKALDYFKKNYEPSP